MNICVFVLCLDLFGFQYLGLVFFAGRAAETLDGPYYHKVLLPRIPGYHKLDKQATLMLNPRNFLFSLVCLEIPHHTVAFCLVLHFSDTLEDRIKRWKNTLDRKAPPSLSQIKVACSIADALSFLHSNRILFRDLKPANVGFDSTGVLKLFDFGFAVSLDAPARPPSANGSSTRGGGSGRSVSSAGTEEGLPLLYDRCGTPRYMAPEVGLDLVCVY